MYTYARVHAYMDTCVYVCTGYMHLIDVCMHLCIYVPIYVCIYEPMYVCM